MIERTSLLSPLQEPRYLEELAIKKEQLLFFDIETTGLKADASSLYLIGCCFFENDKWCLVQWFADDYKSEKKMLSLFIECMKKRPFLVQYNGEAFDLKYLAQKSGIYGIEFPAVIKQSEAYKYKEAKDRDFSEHLLENCRISVDLYRHIQNLKGICCLKSLRLADISAFFGFERKDAFSGGELLYTYSDYMKIRILSQRHTALADFDRDRIYSDYDYNEFHRQIEGKKEEKLLEEMMLHNFEDIVSMLPLFAITRTTELLYYPSLLWNMEKLSEHLYWEENESEKILHAGDLVFPLKNTLVYESNEEPRLSGEKLTLNSGGFTLYSRTIRTELKHFYPDYRNYCYLPIEDYAVHKSIGTYLEKERCQRARPENAYTRHEGEYILLLNKKDALKFIFKQKGLKFPVQFSDYDSNRAYVLFSDINKSLELVEYLKIAVEDRSRNFSVKII